MSRAFWWGKKRPKGHFNSALLPHGFSCKIRFFSILGHLGQKYIISYIRRKIGTFVIYKYAYKDIEKKCPKCPRKEFE